MPNRLGLYLFYLVSPMAAPVYAYPLYKNEEKKSMKAGNKIILNFIYFGFFSIPMTVHIQLYHHAILHTVTITSQSFTAQCDEHLFPAVCVRWYQPLRHNSFHLAKCSNLWLPTFSIQFWKQKTVNSATNSPNIITIIVVSLVTKLYAIYP